MPKSSARGTRLEDLATFVPSDSWHAALYVLAYLRQFVLMVLVA
jgi:hypothetical protein